MLRSLPAMQKEMINNAESDPRGRLNAEHAQGYLKALYDIQRIQLGTDTRYREEIGVCGKKRLVALADKARALD